MKTKTTVDFVPGKGKLYNFMAKVRVSELQLSLFLICRVCCDDKAMCIRENMLDIHGLECFKYIGTLPCEEPVETWELVLSLGRIDNL